MFLQMRLPWHELENSLVHKCFTLKFIDEADRCAILSRATGSGQGGGLRSTDQEPMLPLKVSPEC